MSLHNRVVGHYLVMCFSIILHVDRLFVGNSLIPQEGINFLLAVFKIHFVLVAMAVVADARHLINAYIIINIIIIIIIIIIIFIIITSIG